MSNPRFCSETQLKEFIELYYLNIPPDFLEKVLDAIPANDGFKAGMVRDGDIDYNSRKCNTWSVNIEWINRELWKSMDYIIKDYNSRYGSNITKNNEGYKLIRYEKGDYYRTHVDMGGDRYRSLSIIILLNDDYEGGELSFFHGEYVIRPKKNQAIVFPSTFLYPHEVKEVTSGTRYSVVTWVI